ncbi:zinc ABC transporter permease [Prevotella sp. oral taxon 376]|uniref:GNAT family N-acetyltransferase n=1 Tax=Prevotella sp. oral taxon 376 TaxID=712466 RepID=UPI000D1E26D1|nr:GNAT family N-acetyltransferase [Prevotella sp. oral taxon 376]PTL33417.1 zinc ABC transporter permease [Prevotella sp. oral taxon 376]
MDIENARATQARDIARLIMEAMNHECCQYFAGERHTLQDFEDLMTRLVERDDSQYSYRNTLVAVNERQKVIGICVAYDGRDLHRLRKAFVAGALEAFDRDFSDMDDETQEGEFYIDSLAVSEAFRHRSIATQLLKATVEKARKRGAEAVGLLVDQGNPKAEALYQRIGFIYQNDASWGGHPMRHLQIKL